MMVNPPDEVFRPAAPEYNGVLALLDTMYSSWVGLMFALVGVTVETVKV